MTPIFVGGLIRHYFETRTKNKQQLDERRERGVLLGSGFVGGEGLLGVGIAAAAFIQQKKPEGIGTEWAGSDLLAMMVGLVGFALMASWFFKSIKRA